MNTFINKNLRHVKKTLTALLVVGGIVLAPVLAPSLVYADPPLACQGDNPPASCGSAASPNGAFSDDAACPAGKTGCISGEDADDPALHSGELEGCPSSPCNIVTKYVNPLIKLLSGLAIVAVVIGVIVGGIEYTTSAGDPQQVNKAKIHIRNSIIALLVFFFLYAILGFLMPGAVGK